MLKHIAWRPWTTCNQDSEDDDVREETEEEFLARYAAAAAAAGAESIEVVEEGDIDDETQDIELGKLLKSFIVLYLPQNIFVSRYLPQKVVSWTFASGANAGYLDEVDIKQVVLSLMQKHITLLQAQSLPDDLIERMAETFPESEQMFHARRQT